MISHASNVELAGHFGPGGTDGLLGAVSDKQ